MMIRFNTPVAGTNFSYSPGDVVDWPDERQARRMIERGIAEELTPDAAEKAAASAGRPVRRHQPVETATAGKGKEKATATDKAA